MIIQFENHAVSFSLELWRDGMLTIVAELGSESRSELLQNCCFGHTSDWLPCRRTSLSTQYLAFFVSCFFRLCDTFPSDYVAEIAGSTLGVHNDDYVTFPENVTNLVDLLEAQGLTWRVFAFILRKHGTRSLIGWCRVTWRAILVIATTATRLAGTAICASTIRLLASRISARMPPDAPTSWIRMSSTPTWITTTYAFHIFLRLLRSYLFCFVCVLAVAQLQLLHA